ncbi:MAG: protein translocase subunit SecD, partial [Patescibacteria group bacterium]
NVGKTVGIFLDGAPISLPVIREEIANGSTEISGSFTLDEARILVRDLNYGALPVPITLASVQTIGATLGGDAVDAGVRAGLWAFAIIAAFLVIWYRLPGLLAVVALCAYVALNLAVFKLIPVTLTAAGIAGFVLSMGMAVDANILIFARLKEELKKGKLVADAMREGFARAWPSIRDSNTSSIITAIILYYFAATPVVRGFALVFGLGVVISMFTAITASRMFLYALSTRGVGKASRFLFGSGIRS